jgi:Amt family ammonium transporter
MNMTPGLSLRASAAEEEMGLDDAQLGEFAYDYVELRRDTAALIVGEDKREDLETRDGGVYSSEESIGKLSGEVELMPVGVRAREKIRRGSDRDIEYGIGL